MTETVTIVDGKYILVVSTGRVTNEENERTIEKIMSSYEEKGINKVLIDCSKAEELPSTFDEYKGAKKLSSNMHRMRYALVINEKLKKEQRFFETVVKNRGGIIELFSDKQSALDWLSV